MAECEELHIATGPMPQGLTPKFMTKFVGPFLVVKQVFDDTCKLALPLEIKASSVPCLIAERVFQRLGEAGARTSFVAYTGTCGNHEEYEVETILNKRKLRSQGTEYLVKWRGYHVKEAT